jgi:TRAP-type mannitol/chloroaromatic compound transport system permease small subunit
MTSPVVTGRPRSTLAGWCDAIDRLNEFVGWLLGPIVIFVSAAILYEVISRGVFNEGSVWVNEASVYGSSAVYLLVGGYAMLHRRHVRIDMLFGVLSPRVIRILDLIAFPFLLMYALALIVVGGQFAWASFLQSEGTGTPWNPAIWPVKACIPLAGVLLLLQGLANLARDVGLVAPAKESA